jgi:ligand-binding sensor domain-containing protein
MHFCFRSGSAVCLVIALAMATASHALEPATPLKQLGRQSWSMENGLPQNTVPVLLQSRDGFLWAGTELGLARFDGVSFRIFDHTTMAAFPDAEIRCLLDAADRSMWVGTADGLLLWKDGRSTLLTTHEGLPSNSIRELVETTDGTVWIRTESGLARWNGHRVEQVATENGLPGDGITSMAADRQQGLWVGTMRGTAVFRQGHWLRGPGSNLPAGATDAPKRAVYAQTSLVSAVSGGDVLIAGSDGVFQVHDGSASAVLSKTELP